SPIKVAYDKHALLGISHWGRIRQRFYGYASNRVSKYDVYSTKRILALTNVKVKEWYGYGHLEEIEVRRSDQQLLFNLKGDVIVRLAAALRIFTRLTVHSSVRDTLKDMANNLDMGYTSVMPRRRWSNLDKKRSRIMVKDINRQLLERKLGRSLEMSFSYSILQAGNPVNEILLKLNLPDHSDEVLKLKNFKKDGYSSFQEQEKYEHVGPKVTSSQDGKTSQDDDKRLCLADDLKKLKITCIDNVDKNNSKDVQLQDEDIMYDIDLYFVVESNNELESDIEDVIPEVADLDAVIEELTDSHKTPRATLYEHDETPGGSIYWKPRVHGISIPVEGAYFDTLDEAIDMYTSYAEMREKVFQNILMSTLDPQHNEKQKRNTIHHITSCKARIKLVLDIVYGKYKLVQFYPKHNHVLIPKEYKHFTKKQRKMTQAGKMFVVKAATNKIGATRAHNLLSSMKGGYEYVHRTTDDFKNHQKDVNVFIDEKNSELVAMFWADKVAKCNYKEFGDIVSFDATFNNNKYNMKFVPLIGVDNYRKCVTLGPGMLLHEDTESYTWLLKAFMTAFLKEPTMIVTDQDGAMKRAIEAIFTKAKHRLCMWHIMQKISSKICKEIYDETDFKERFKKIVWNMFMELLKFEEK
ncbi:FAR1-related sequence 5-like protein, partial [Tanacetum coccineum]